MQDLVNNLCNCESTYLERVDDVRDEMINHWLGNFGSRLRLIAGSIHYLMHVKRRMGFHKSTLVARGADTQLDSSCVSAPLATNVDLFACFANSQNNTILALNSIERPATFHRL